MIPKLISEVWDKCLLGLRFKYLKTEKEMLDILSNKTQLVKTATTSVLSLHTRPTKAFLAQSELVEVEKFKFFTCPTSYSQLHRVFHKKNILCMKEFPGESIKDINFYLFKIICNLFTENIKEVYSYIV